MSDQYTEHYGQEDTADDVRGDQADPRPRGDPGAAPAQDPRRRAGPGRPPTLRARDDGDVRGEPADGPRGAAGGRELGPGRGAPRRSGRPAGAGPAERGGGAGPRRPTVSRTDLGR